MKTCYIRNFHPLENREDRLTMGGGVKQPLKKGTTGETLGGAWIPATNIPPPLPKLKLPDQRQESYDLHHFAIGQWTLETQRIYREPSKTFTTLEITRLFREDKQKIRKLSERGLSPTLLLVEGMTIFTIFPFPSSFIISRDTSLVPNFLGPKQQLSIVLTPKKLVWRRVKNQIWNSVQQPNQLIL